MKGMSAILSLVILLQGCASAPQPAPVEDRGMQSRNSTPVPDIGPSMGQTGEAEPIPFQPNPAVASLLQQARAAQEGGSYSIAASKLERALRIEPDNAFVWSELAGVRLLQRDWAQAIELATRSSDLAPENPSIRARNWRTIGAARRARGDLAGAETAIQRAREIAEHQSRF